MIDPAVRLALALHSNPGAYAALLGSGISAAAGIPTGWQIVSDLIAKVARLEGAAIEGDPVDWYRSRYGQEPEYSSLLDELGRSPAERNLLLRGYFEPSPEDRRRGLRVPGEAHRSLAKLAAKGYISVFLTTNFDRLLEQALEDAGIVPTVLSTPDSLAGSPPLGRSRCTVIKLNGDYLDSRIKNTVDELESYDPAIEKLLDRVLDEYGLIVCGWSADWDAGLRSAFERCASHRYTTFWASRSAPKGQAARLIELRQGEHLPIADAGQLFTDLVTKVSALEDGTSEQPGGQPAAPTRPSGLPARATAFVGRKAELGQIRDRLEDTAVRLLTLVGPGGTGKTSLAVRVAEDFNGEFEGQISFVDLSSCRDASSVIIQIARAVALGEVIDGSLLAALTGSLRDGKMMLVLDNFEQVTEAAGPVAQLLAECPALKMVVTSREALHLRAEYVFPVQPLELPPVRRQPTAAEVARCEAAELFVDRARAVRPEFQITDANAAAVADICRQLDGLPLAIELAAARLRLFTPEALRDRLGDRLGMLRSGPRDLPERQQTLRATMDWSYELLTPAEQRLFEILAVFADADIPAIVALAEGAALDSNLDALEVLGGLIDKSLVRDAAGSAGESRFKMLDSIHEFATFRLEQQPEFAARVKRVHAEYFADFARGLRTDLSGERRAAALSAMAAERGNLLIAWRFWLVESNLEQLQKLIDSILLMNEARGWYLDTVALTSDLLTVLATSTSSTERVGMEIALKISLARALMATKGFTPEVDEAYAGALELFERGASANQQFSVLRGLVNLYQLRGQVDKAIPLGEQILELGEREGSSRIVIDGCLVLGTARLFDDDIEGGLELLERGIALFGEVPKHEAVPRVSNDPRVACLTTSAFGLWLSGRPDRAVERMKEAIVFARDLGFPFTTAFAHFHAGLLYHWNRQSDLALEQANILLEIADEFDFAIWTAAGRSLKGAAQVELGNSEEGLANLRNGLDLYQLRRSPPVFWIMLLFLDASARLRAGSPEEGLRTLEPAVEIMEGGPGTVLASMFFALKGDLLLALAEGSEFRRLEAEDWYRRAVDRARVAMANYSELRAVIRQSRLWISRGNGSAVAEALIPLLDMYSDTMDTPDLREARELLASARRSP